MIRFRCNSCRLVWVITLFLAVFLTHAPGLAATSGSSKSWTPAPTLIGSFFFAQSSIEEEVSELGERIQKIWNYEIFKVQDRPIFVKTFVVGLLLLILSIWFAKIITRILGKRVLPKMGLNESASAAFQTVGFYLLVVIFTLFVLQVINVPLTIFTLLGGALAIGVGFGSQNVMNNFISGLIILAERPIKIGDLIQLDNVYGTINRIGARSTRVRTSDNIDIIVPNSVFLENKVINWTLTDNEVRTRVAVGFAYGSDTETAKKLLLQAADEHSRVLKKPQPLVLFREFGDNALHFELLIWIVMRSQMDRIITESELRFRIDALCRELDVVIAFPQRDIHIDADKPLEIHLIK